MKTTQVLACLTGVAQVVQGLEAPIEGYEVADFGWEVQTGPDAALHQINGTVQDVVQYLKEVDPTYELPETPVPELGRRQSTVKPRQVTIDCHWDWPTAFAGRIDQGVDYLNSVAGTPTNGPGPGACGRVSCSYNSAIWWCNDNLVAYTLPSYKNIADGAHNVREKCSSTDSEGNTISAGQGWFDGKQVNAPYPGVGTVGERPSEDEAALFSKKYFWMPSSTLLHSPLDGPKWPVPDVFLPPQSPTVSAALVKNPSRNSRRAASSTLRDQSPRSEKSPSQSLQSERSTSPGPSRKPRQVETAPPTRPATSGGGAPMRPASPKSRNASRTGRPARRASEVENPDLDEMIERLEALRRKTQSAAAQRQDYSGTPSQDRPRSPKSRNASRSGRPLESEISFAERAFNLSRGSIPIGASESVLASNIPRPQSDILGKRNLHNGSAVRAPSRGNYRTLSDPERPSSRGENAPQGMDAPVAHIEPDESRTMLWSEISKIVGEHIGRPDSRESIRGRQRNDSTMSTQARQGSRGAPPANNRGAASQTRQGNGDMIRSVRDPSMGPPANPDDEIVAEIIFRRPGGPNQQNSRSNSAENTITHGEGAGSTDPTRDPSRRSPETDSTPAKKVTSPLFKGGKKSISVEHDRKHSSVPPGHRNDEGGEPDAAGALPGLAGSSIHTLNSTKTSPTTPSPRAFEPSTPKAMILSPDYGSFMSTASDPLSNTRFESLNNTLVDDKAAAQIDRPRSAIW